MDSKTQLEQTLLVAVPIFVLVDPLAGDPVQANVDGIAEIETINRVRTEVWQRDVWTVPLHKKIELAPADYPYLVALQPNQDPLIEETLIFADAERLATQADGLQGTGQGPHAIGGWIQTTQAPTALTNTLSQMMIVKTEALTKARYQRIADRRVFDLLQSIVGHTRLAESMGDIQRWSYLDVFGNIKQLNKVKSTADTLHLSTSEWQRFIQGAAQHQTIARWLGERNKTQTMPIASPTIYEHAATAIANAKRAAKKWPQRFQQIEDQTAWAALNLLHGKLATHPTVLDVLNMPTPQDEPANTLHTLCTQLNLQLQKETRS